MTLAVERQKHRIEMPFVPGPGPSAPPHSTELRGRPMSLRGGEQLAP
jgi:hypothetical protein